MNKILQLYILENKILLNQIRGYVSFLRKGFRYGFVGLKKYPEMTGFFYVTVCFLLQLLI